MPITKSKTGFCPIYKCTMQLSIEYNEFPIADENFRTVGTYLKRGRIVALTCEMECGSFSNCPIYEQFPKKI